MSIVIDKVVLPAIWASALINDDWSCVWIADDLDRLEAWIAANPTSRVVSCGESYLSRDMGDGSGLAGEVCDYDIHIVKPRPKIFPYEYQWK